MVDGSYVQALQAAEFITGPPRIKGMVLWTGAGLRAVRELVTMFQSLVAERYQPTVVEYGFLADGPAYRAVFGGYANVYSVAPDAPAIGGAMLRADNIVTTVAALRAAQSLEPRIAVGGLLRRFDGRTPPLFRDRYIWPAVQLTQRVHPDTSLRALDFYRCVVERLLALLGLPTVTVRTPALADYGRVTYLVVSVLPDGRPTVLATLYILGDGLRRAQHEELDIIDVGFTGKLIATCAMLHHDDRGLLLPSLLASVQVGVTTAGHTDPALVESWRKELAGADIRSRVRTGAGTPGRRLRAERHWQRLGAPVIIGLDRDLPGEVIRATRAPLTRVALPGLPAAPVLRATLIEHDARLLRAGRRLLDRCFDAGHYLRALCATCAGRSPIFGTVVPERAARCEDCAAEGTVLFVSEEGRFY